MYILLSFLVFVAIVFAEKPKGESFQGYQPSGWRPSGIEFVLPQRSQRDNQNTIPMFDGQVNGRQNKNLIPVFNGQVNAQQNKNSVPVLNGQVNVFVRDSPGVLGSQNKNLNESLTFIDDRSSEGSGSVNPQEKSSVPNYQQNIYKTTVVSQVDNQYSLPKETTAFQDFQNKNSRNEPQETSGSSNSERRIQFNSSGAQSRKLNFFQVDLTYSAPQDTLIAPPNQPAVTYGPPEDQSTTVTSTTETETTTTDLPVTTEYSTGGLDSYKQTAASLLEEVKDNQQEEKWSQENGVYYIYHPSGLLQRVVYATKDDQANMAFSAHLKYENVEPIQSPVYTYDPETFLLKRVYK